MEWIIIIGYGVGLLVICTFSVEQLYLALLYRGKKRKQETFTPLTTYPTVTVQLPVYNEKYVVERLVNCICNLDYPKDKLEIQVLDDSTDETSEILQRTINHWSGMGLDITRIRRKSREGYKAGALAYGMHSAKGDFIAIFDSDFLPEPDFLIKTLPAFEANTGMVQTRWGHLNEHYSLLTEAQAFGLNAHFTVEQTGRNTSDKLMNFNGTAGVWRKECIIDAGGWQFDTLTEDLDLSYRAQLKGWQFQYLEDVLAPAELPVLVSAIKSQQYRWNKGAAETARKNLFSIFTSKLSLHKKIHAAFHLLNSSVFIFLLVAAILSIPMLYIKEARPDLALLFNLASIFVIGFLSMTVFYWVAAKAVKPELSIKEYMLRFPVFLTLSMGMALHNTIAVLEGYLGVKTPFVRTPKFNIKKRTDSWEGNIYLKRILSPITIFEGILALYFMFGIVSAFMLKDFGLILFHLMLTIGFGLVFFLSIRPFSYVKAG